MKKKSPILLAVLMLFGIVPSTVSSSTNEYKDVLENYNLRIRKNNSLDKDKYEVVGEGNAYYGTTKYTPNTNSLVVELGAGAVFNFNEVINIKERNYEQNLFSFFPITSTPRLLDAYTMKVKFTDAYDSSKYLIVEYSASREGLSHGVVYIKAGGENQTPTGYEEQLGKIHVGNIWGFGQSCNMYCCNKDSSLFTEDEYLNNSTSIFYNYETGEVKTNKNSYGFNNICNVKSSEFFDEFWGGMTTGECFVSVWFENYICPTASLCITNIDKKDLSTKNLLDTSNPILIIDELFDTLPNGVVDQKYSFYDAKALDQYDGELTTKIKVYQNYYSTNKINVSSSVDGFIPRKQGTYYIEYSATDASGNKAAKVYEVYCSKEKQNISLDLDGTYKTMGYVGETIEIAKVSIEGTCGNPKLSKTLILPNGDRKAVTSNFVPETQGIYKVEFVVTDFIGSTATIVYEVNVSISETPVIQGEADILPYYIAGYYYKLPNLTAIDYNKIDAHTNVLVKIVDGDNVTTATNNEVAFTQTESKVRDAKIVYEASNDSGTAKKEYDIKIYSTSYDGFVHMDKYFDLDNATVTSNTDYLKISSDTNGKATFINNLAASNFELNFNFGTQNNSFERFNIYLTDSKNDEEQLKFSYLHSTGISKIVINDKNTVVKEGQGNFAEGEQFVKLDTSNNKVQFKANELVNLTQYLNGNPYNGFTSGSVYLTLEFVNPNNLTCDFYLKYLNSQKMSSLKYDYIEPRIVLNGDYGGASSLGEVVNICSAKVFDVLDPNPSISLSVIDKNRKPVKDVHGKAVSEVSCDSDIQFTVTEYGTYQVIYTAYDYDGNEANYYYVVGVYDRVLPTINLQSKNKTSAKLNETVALAKADVSDNYSPLEKIKFYLYVICPTGAMELVNNYSYKFVQKGKHVIRYLAIDEESNLTIVDNEINVIGG